jgi:hypothetical protein
LNDIAIWTGAILLLVALLIAVINLMRYRRLRRRTVALRRLLDDADRFEQDLRECRRRLDKAHAVMAVAPDVPVEGQVAARQSVNAGLRSILQHRLWIRDHGASASQAELDTAVQALAQARAQLEPQLRALGQAQHDLDEAVRERIERDGQP